jgi:hypothetical protein
MGQCKKSHASIFLSKTIWVTVSNLREEIHNDFKNELKNNYITLPHGGAIKAHFTFCPITLEP